jgi:hypothetical protein
VDRRSLNLDNVARGVSNTSASPKVGNRNSHTGSARCPRCGGVLRFPDTLAACYDCGYSRSGGEPDPSESETTPQKRRSDVDEFFAATRKLPGWVWILSFGVLAIAAASVAANHLLPNYSYRRALWTTLELGIGVVALFTAQIWALFLLAGEDGLGPMDIIYPFRFWSASFGKLPRTSRPLCLGSWALTAALCSVLFVGGLGYWLPGKRPVQLSSASSGDGFTPGDTDLVNLEDALNEAIRPENFANADNGPQDPDDEADDRPVARCVVIGYTMSDKGGLDSVVLGLETKTGLHFVGVVRKGLKPELSKKILDQLTDLVQTEPAAVNGVTAKMTVNATWVKPTISCAVSQSGISASKGTLVEPRFKNLLERP